MGIDVGDVGTDVDDVGTDVDDVGMQTCVWRQGRTLQPLLMWELEAKVSSHPPDLVVLSSLAPPGGTSHRADGGGGVGGGGVGEGGQNVFNKKVVPPSTRPR